MIIYLLCVYFYILLNSDFVHVTLKKDMLLVFNLHEVLCI